MMPRSSRILIPGLLLLLSLFACCEKPGADSPSATTGASISPDAQNPPSRIVSLAPSVTETLFSLGAGDSVVGVTRFCDAPVAATTLPKIGGLTDVDVEMVLSLEPDLVVGVNSKTSRGLQQTLDRADIATLFLPVESFAEVQQSIRTLGERVGETAKAAKLAEAIARHDLQPAADAPRVLVLFGRDPFIGAGPGTFADEMVRRAGGHNALKNLATPYPSLDVEKLGALDPDLVIDTTWTAGEQATTPPIEGVATIRMDPALMRPGPRLATAMDFFVRAIEEAASQ